VALIKNKYWKGTRFTNYAGKPDWADAHTGKEKASSQCEKAKWGGVWMGPHGMGRGRFQSYQISISKNPSRGLSGGKSILGRVEGGLKGGEQGGGVHWQRMGT